MLKKMKYEELQTKEKNDMNATSEVNSSTTREKTTEYREASI